MAAASPVPAALIPAVASIPAVPDWALLAGIVAILVAALLFRRRNGDGGSR